MKKNIVVLGIILLLIFISTNPISIGFGFENIIDDEIQVRKDSQRIVTSENGTSIHMNLTDTNFWYVVKMDLSEEMNISFKHDINSIYILDEVVARGYFCAVTFYNKERNISANSRSLGLRATPGDRYFKVNILGVNWSRYHFPEADIYSSGGNGTWLLSLENGTWYAVIFGYIPNGYYDFWINTSKIVDYSTAQGNDSFFLQREDFVGNLNIGWHKGTILVNCEKKFNIKNSFFAHIDYDINPGILYIKYKEPNGINRWLFEVFNKNSHIPIYRKRSDGYPWNNKIQNGVNGQWTFNFDLIALNNDYIPNILLFGADVILPE